MSSKRAPSQYNLFVKEYIAKHPGSNFHEAATAWKHKKECCAKPAEHFEVFDTKKKK